MDKQPHRAYPVCGHLASFDQRPSPGVQVCVSNIPIEGFIVSLTVSVVMMWLVQICQGATAGTGFRLQLWRYDDPHLQFAECSGCVKPREGTQIPC